MKNEYKILIGAIIVIIIVLVGAFALSGSNNAQPSVTPTVLPVTVTPTPVPANGGNTGTGAATPTATPLPSVTPTPTPTPTPEPASGVKQTEFGYYITYPPLGPENWSSPHPMPVSGNTVYFSPTSQTVTVPVNFEAGATVVTQGAQATVHRDGDLSGTTTVGIYVIPSDNMYWPEDYYSEFSIVTGPNMTWISDSYFNLTFGPGVSQQTINIRTYPVYEDDSVKAADEGIDFSGTVKLDIVEVDDGYNIGSDHSYTLYINSQDMTPVVQFQSSSGSLSGPTNCVIENINGKQYNISIVITRSGDLSGTFTPDVSIDDTNVDYSDGFYWLSTDAFQTGQSTTKAYFSYNPGDYSVEDPYADLAIGTSTHYTVGSPSTYSLDLYTEQPPT